MADERVLSDIVTKFFLSTCRLRSQLSNHVIQAVALSAETTTRINGDEVNVVPLTTGSAAEFYIEPMLPHIGDVDVIVTPLSTIE